MPADPDATSAPRDSGALVEDPPRDGEASTSAIDAFFDGSADPRPERRPTRSRERREIAPTEPKVQRRPRMQARKVHRLVRHIEPWSVLKISLIFFFCIWVILLTSAVILWRVASGSGVIDNIESFIEEIFALDSFAFEAGQMFRAYAVGGLVMVVAATGFAVLLAVLFNLISDLTGGIRVTVVEEESARYVDSAEAPAIGDGNASKSPPASATSSPSPR